MTGSSENAREVDWMLRIGEFSKLSMVSIKTLRHYDEIGLLTPAEIDRFTAYRYYGEEQLAVAGRIRALRDMGFGLAAIGEILRSGGERSTLEKHLFLRQRELAEQAETTARQLVLLKTAITRLRKEETPMHYPVTLKQLPERRVASVRQVIPDYAKEGVLWNLLMSETAPLHMQDSEPCYAIAVFHDEEYKESDVDIEVQMTVKGEYADTEHVRFKTEPPVLIASATYQGSYEQMPAVNEAVAAWIRDNGYALSGAAFNIYHVSPNETQNAEDYVTEVCYPVKKS